ncbi:kinase-like domain-containing protein [Rhizophagus clarus]|uniref:Kinase-like domain-containing protein n=1 Tax=Rhizophagus clarus TaxID=94130 RepID=A0A8H3LAT2_9GLOM|nr:kinase-like domain-containing protein [Rhizophagus clarus]
MLSLTNSYRNGEGTETNLEKAFYWYHKVVEESSTSKVNFKIKVESCSKCNQPYSDYQWCHQCNSKQFQLDFSNWTSKNEFIDEFIKEAQLNAKSSYEVLEWIPYNKLTSINYHDKGGFTGYEVILKTLNNSSNLNNEFLDEWKYHYNYLMRKCWDSNPFNRPTIIEIEHQISEWIRYINEYYSANTGRYEFHRFKIPNIDNKSKNDMFEFIKANNNHALEQSNIPIIQSHSQAYYASCKLTEISECFECMI